MKIITGQFLTPNREVAPNVKVVPDGKKELDELRNVLHKLILKYRFEKIDENKGIDKFRSSKEKQLTELKNNLSLYSGDWQDCASIDTLRVSLLSNLFE